MNQLQTCAMTIALLFCIGIHAKVLAAAGSQASAPSFRGGFSSQRASSVSRPTPAPRSGQFGGFGGTRPSAAPAPAPKRSEPSNNSPLSRDLVQQASHERALRTLDSRRAAQSPPAAPPAAMPAPSQQAGLPMPVPMQSAPPIVIQQRSGVGDLLTGVLIGRAMSNSNPTVYGGGAGAHIDLSGDYQGARSQGSFFGGVVRLFMWLIVLAAICWAIVFGLRAFKRAKQIRTPNYTFERQ